MTYSSEQRHEQHMALQILVIVFACYVHTFAFTCVHVCVMHHVVPHTGQGLTVRFEQSRYSVKEGNFLSFRLIALGTFSSNFSVNVSLQPITAGEQANSVHIIYVNKLVTTIV